MARKLARAGRSTHEEVAQARGNVTRALEDALRECIYLEAIERDPPGRRRVLEVQRALIEALGIDLGIDPDSRPMLLPGPKRVAAVRRALRAIERRHETWKVERLARYILQDLGLERPSSSSLADLRGHTLSTSRAREKFLRAILRAGGLTARQAIDFTSSL